MKSTSGRFSQISLPAGAEEKRSRKSAEEIVKREEARKSLPWREIGFNEHSRTEKRCSSADGDRVLGMLKKVKLRGLEKSELAVHLCGGSL